MDIYIFAYYNLCVKTNLATRTMHASLMRRMGGRLEVARDNMGHAGNTGSITLDVYSKSWWEERVDAVTRVVEAVFTEPEEKKEEVESNVASPKHLREGARDEPWVPQPNKLDQFSTEVTEKDWSALEDDLRTFIFQIDC